ncbi:MAG: hypothetical protein H0A76_00050 [Candidatus Thiodubiliella endoseptemdiera]|uniref:VCBS repeat-containing protein n=1 Tax=Candidatus Thiodubiliella endoseptemdiera TaxID=2738886 RepID=A0A853EYD9_9GAMM|nr:hypothetical protein [Candidatus Thiodubiliella endoseptemdiera]
MKQKTEMITLMALMWIYYSSKPFLADIDGDGDLDLVVGEVYGTLKYYYNQQPSSVDGQAPNSNGY